MAVDFEVNESTDWGDNESFNDLHSVLFDEVSHVINTNGSEQGKRLKKNIRKKKRLKTDEKSDKDEKIVEKLIRKEGTKKKQKHKGQDESEISTKVEKTNVKHKGKKRKMVDDSQLEPNILKKKKKTLNSKTTVKGKVKQGDEENKDFAVESKKGKKKKGKLKVKDEMKPSETEANGSDLQDNLKTKTKKKRKRKAVNKFKTEEFLNRKNLCGKFVDLTAPPPKINKKDIKIIPMKETNSNSQPNINDKQQQNVSQKGKKGKKHKKEENKNETEQQNVSQKGNPSKKQRKRAQKEELEKDEEKSNRSDEEISKETESKKKKPIDLRTKMENKLKGARFRFINEKLYTCTGDSALELFTEDREAFQVYHDGFVEQVKTWPVNPVDTIIADLLKMPSSKVVGDFGCGDAKISKSVKQKVHSFDLVATNKNVVACNMANVPLSDGELDVAIFCLSLMGTNWIDYLKEANRVLKNKGMLKISEVSSRFQNLKAFVLAMKRLGFSQIHKDTSNKFFISFDFKKQSSPKEISEGMNEILKPCLYKKR
ncbi:ribosomal RNA-processing protein 8-like [Anneissia japonica]|uniref:ribosomal RNA-processing protein 8-like n=1 Tax=Anneissia japonica TaxID=1529436 RepID=UPI00142591F7|nr:ribosomal RNA-processing protein 8-like [Anneissia japonica]